MENYFQWSELEDEETGIEDTAEKPERNNPGLSGDDKISKVVQDDARIPKEQVQERGSERTDKGFENNTKQSRVEFGNSTETDASLSDSVKSNMDEKDSLPSSSTEDVEYHIKHCEYFMPCHVIPYHTIPYHTMPCHAMPCHAMPCHAMPCHAMPCHAMPCHAMPCHAMPYHTIPYHTMTY